MSAKMIRHIFRFSGFWASFKLAVRGIVFLFLYHRNMRIIFLLGLLALLSGVQFQLKGIELVALCITVTLVLMAEIFNTAVEMMMDILTETYNTKVKLIKDISAAVVVLTCLNAVAVGYIIFLRKLFR
jgi:diacylglycerol kinase (ATP)